MTLDELAKRLDLSPSTVSRSINQPELVAVSTRERVLEAVERYGYRPNSIARSLRTRDTRSIGLVVSDICNPFYAAIVRSVERVARGRGYSVIICNADEDPAREEEALNLLGEKQVSGIIHAATGANVTALAGLRDRGVPVIDIDRASGLPDADAVLTDNLLGARLAAGHLIALGHRSVATVAGPPHLTTGRDRLEGFRAALEAAGVQLPPEYVQVGDFQMASAEAAVHRLLDLPQAPTALFVANNEMMAGALGAIRARGVRVPEQLSTVSFDDVRWGRYLEPPLTVVAQAVEAMGEMAADLVLRRIAGETGHVRRVLDPVLVVRGSTAPPPTRGSSARGADRLGPPTSQSISAQRR